MNTSALIPVEPSDVDHPWFDTLAAHLPAGLIGPLADESTVFLEVYGPGGDLVGVEARVGDPLEHVCRFEPPLRCTLTMDPAGNYTAYRAGELIAAGTAEELDLLERQIVN